MKKNKNKNREAILHLSLISGVGGSTVGSLLKLDHFDFGPNGLYELSLKDLTRKFGLSERVASLCFDGLKNKNLLENELALINKEKDVKWLTLIDSEYPPLLKEIHSPPPVIYIKGKPSEFNSQSLAIVGSRQGGTYAKKVLEKLIPDIVTSGLDIVSGGALGVDSIAHEITLSNAGITHVILGSGLLNPYPLTNKKLFEEVISSGGSVISCFPMKTSPEKWNFPARNRIIAGLSSGCLVVSAPSKSGALITSKYALEEGRQVFAVPGDIFDELNAGCNQLISQGAKAVSKSNDIFEEIGIVPGKNKNTEVENEKQNVKEEESDPLLKILTSWHSIDEISQKLRLPHNETQLQLLNLNISGKVSQNHAGLWGKI